jgi:hypothetical protein
VGLPTDVVGELHALLRGKGLDPDSLDGQTFVAAVAPAAAAPAVAALPGHSAKPRVVVLSSLQIGPAFLAQYNGAPLPRSADPGPGAETQFLQLPPLSVLGRVVHVFATVPPWHRDGGLMRLCTPPFVCSSATSCPRCSKRYPTDLPFLGGCVQGGTQPPYLRRPGPPTEVQQQAYRDRSDAAAARHGGTYHVQQQTGGGWVGAIWTTKQDFDPPNPSDPRETRHVLLHTPTFKGEGARERAGAAVDLLKQAMHDNHLRKVRNNDAWNGGVALPVREWRSCSTAQEFDDAVEEVKRKFL